MTRNDVSIMMCNAIGDIKYLEKCFIKTVKEPGQVWLKATQIKAMTHNTRV